MKKKGQIYILVALVIGIVVFLVVSRTNIFVKEEPVSDIEFLSENYLKESSKLINSLLGSNTENVSDALSQATTKFVYEYARTRDPDFGLIYVFTDEDQAIIENYLDAKVIVDAKEKQEVLTNPEEEIELGSINYGGVEIPQGYTYSRVKVEFPILFEEVLKEKFIGEVHIEEGDQIILAIDEIQYYFIVGGNTVELSAIARRIEGNQVQVFQTYRK